MVYGDCVYGEGIYGLDCTDRPPSPPTHVAMPPRGHTEKCCCRQGAWRFEACDILTGRVKAVLHPVSANWEEKESAPGNGTMVLASQDLRPDNLWVHTTTVYISQVINGVRVGRWAGIVEDFDSVGGGAVQVGLKSIDNYLNQRNLADANGGITLSFAKISQTEIAATLAEAALTVGGISMFATAGVSAHKRDRTYHSWDFKNIGEAIHQLSEVISGIRYRLYHVHKDEGSGSSWRTEIRFLDTAGEDRKVKLRGGREGASYRLRVDGRNHATWAFGIGEGEEKLQKVSIAYDQALIYPYFHAVPAWKDVSVQETLDAHTAGYIANHRDPVTTPSITLPGLDPAPERLQLGDRVWVEFEYGLTTFKGYCKILSISWSISDGTPVYRALAFAPEIRPGDGVRVLEPPVTPPTPPGNPPSAEPKAGIVSRLQDQRINESSGLTHSRSDS